MDFIEFIFVSFIGLMLSLFIYMIVTILIDEYRYDKKVKQRDLIYLAKVSGLEMYGCNMQFSVKPCTFGEFKKRCSCSLSYHADDDAEGYEVPTKDDGSVWLPKDVFHSIFSSIVNNLL